MAKPHPQSMRDRLDAERTIHLSRYQEDGCESRTEYLEQLADENLLTLGQITMLVDLLGPDEDFDGLVNMIEDHQEALRDI